MKTQRPEGGVGGAGWGTRLLVQGAGWAPTAGQGCYSLATDPGIPRDTEGGGWGALKVFNRHQPGSVVLSG